MVIYTKAIDVAYLPFVIRVGSLLGDDGCAMKTYYDIANETWLQWQNNIVSEINALPGNPQAFHGKAESIHVDAEKIISALKSSDPITIQNLSSCH
jgi:hypothetical protein